MAKTKSAIFENRRSSARQRKRLSGFYKKRKNSPQSKLAGIEKEINSRGLLYCTFCGLNLRANSSEGETKCMFGAAGELREFDCPFSQGPCRPAYKKGQ